MVHPSVAAAVDPRPTRRAAEPDVREDIRKTGWPCGRSGRPPLVGRNTVQRVRIGRIRLHPRGAFRQNLVVVVTGAYYGGKHVIQEPVRHLIIEEMAQAVHEDPAGFRPVQGLIQPFGMTRDVLRRMRGCPGRRGPDEPVAEPFGVTGFTTGRDSGSP